MKLKSSIFTKLFLVIILTGLIIDLLVGGFFRHHFIHGTENIFHRNVNIYSDYIIKDIGTPPDLEKAKEIALRTMIQVKVTGPAVDWSTTDQPLDVPPESNYIVHENARYGWHHGTFVYIKRKGDYQYTFFSSMVPRQGKLWHFIILLVLLLLVSITAFLLIRRILRPVKLLSRGVQEISAGNLDYDVPIIGRNELGDLTRSFNSMKNQVREMLHARDQLLVDVSHELRSPLTRMKVALEFIDNKKIRNDISEDINGLEKMITEILETERLKHQNYKLDMDEFDIMALIRDVSGSLGSLKRDITLNCPDEPVIITADRGRVRTVVRNVLENAYKYSDDRERQVEVTCQITDDDVAIHIQDHGEGIPGEELPYLFEPFYRVDESRSRETGGYGLGLSLCKKIMEAHGGDITIESKEGAGTTVVLRFPQ